MQSYTLARSDVAQLRTVDYEELCIQVRYKIDVLHVHLVQFDQNKTTGGAKDIHPC